LLAIISIIQTAGTPRLLSRSLSKRFVFDDREDFDA
jgi:hypothetical protein